ncbi:bile acid:sodium symporter, partial [Escherichia coli]|uniref:bile acid:sodium symporter n=1 Tax=Escherichia coli TaxID=562 RepID=UPI003D9A1E6F
MFRSTSWACCSAFCRLWSFLSAKGDVALSVTISSVSTLVGVVATPLLTRLYVDAHIQVDVMGMLLSILQIVVIPI